MKSNLKTIGTRTVERLETISERNEQVAAVFHALDEVIQSVDKCNRYNLNEPKEDFRKVYNWAKQHRSLFSDKQWNVVQTKVQLMKQALDAKKLSVTSPVIPNSSERKKNFILTPELIECGETLASSDYSFQRCLTFADEWLSFYNDSQPTMEIERAKSIIMNRCMRARQGEANCIWLWYGSKENIPETSPWKWYGDVLDADGNYKISEEERDRIADSMEEWSSKDKLIG